MWAGLALTAPIQTRTMWAIELMVEEFLEKIGVIVLIHAISYHLSITTGRLSLRIDGTGP